MGSSSSKNLGAPMGSASLRAQNYGQHEFYEHVSNSAYMGAAEKCGANFSGGYEGGCGCDRNGGFIGADELDTSTVREYTNSINSKAKNQIIDELVQAAQNLGMKITGSTQQEKIKSMLDLLPSGSRIHAADDTHKKLCAALARAINNAHGSEIIGKDMPPEVICQQVAEIVSSLAAGMHTEFLAVYNDVRRVLKNLNVLKDALKDDHEAIVLKIKESDDALLPQQLTTLNDLHGILTEEIERQIQLLSNLLNVTLFPTEKDLAHLIKNKKDLHGYIDKINVKVGSDKFSKVISDILKGLGLTANFALLIERALKTVGITLDEYAKGESVQKLREKITQGIMGKKMDESQLHEYLEAAELLYRNFYRNQDIAKTIEAHKTGSEEMEYSGGDDNYPKTTMDKRIADRKKVRNLIFNTFYRQLNGLFDQMIGSIDSLTLKVGTEIPLSDQLNSFRHILQRIDENLVRNKNIYYALIGYYNDAMSKSKKDALIADLNMVSSYIDTLIEMPIYASSKQYFTAVQGHIKAIISLIDRFSDEIAAKFGRGEDSESSCVYLEETEGDKEGGFDFPDAVYGGADSLVSEEIEPKIMFKSTKTIHDAVRQFDYKVRVAQIRNNMSATGKELQHYSEKYEKIIANSIADILEDDKKTYEKLHKQLSDDSMFGDAKEYVVDHAIGFTDEKLVEKERAAAMKILETQWETKKKFWATVEAVDTYMRVFTDALVKNPQDIKEIKSMIDSVEVINEWYSDKTGENLAGVFDYFPSYMKNQGITSNDATPYISQDLIYPPDEYHEDTSSHYYKRIRNQLDKRTGSAPLNTADDVKFSALPGNPYLVTIPTKGEQAHLHAKKTLGGLSILKNLLSVFIHVGAKFGGQELRNKVFMSPTQMYNNLVDYLHTSAFAQGFGVGDFRAVPDNELPPEFYTSDKMSIEANMRSGEVVKVGDVAQVSTAGGRNRWGSTSTYVPGSEIVHLGVTSDAAVGITDYHYAKSSIAPALVDKINTATDALAGRINAKKYAAASTYGVGADLGGNPIVQVNPALPLGANPSPLSWKSSTNNVDKVLLFKKRWGVWMRSILPGLKEMEGFSFKREDEYFILILKSLAAKILTVVGMYDVLDRPMEFNGLSPIRMITGGSSETPKIDDSAVALYLRLPLLAQFYRGIFGFDETEGNTSDDINTFQKYPEWRARSDSRTLKISMVPDVDGTFAGLIRLIFRKNKFISGNNYSDDDLKELIREINLIHQRMQSKYPQNTVMETIHEFVAEINRRYGVVSQTERDQYEKEFGYRYHEINVSESRYSPMESYTSAPDTDIAILPGEDEEEVVRPSSAQKLLGETFETTGDKKRLFTITHEHRDLVYRFRCAIDKYFENPDEEFTFVNAIRATQLKLKHEQNDENRFKLVASLVRGVDVYSKVDGMKYVLFHETVVGGLNLLSAVHSMLARFKRRIHYIDIGGMENKIWSWLASEGQKAFRVGIASDALLQMMRKYFTDELGLAEKDDELTAEIIHKLFGYGESFVCNGGHNNPTNGVGDFALKATDGIKMLGAGGMLQPTHRWDVSAMFGVFKVTDVSTLSAGFRDRRQGVHQVSLEYLNPGADPKSTASTQGGLSTVLAGFSVEQLREAYRTPNPKTKDMKDAKNAAETFMRFIFGREYIMKELLETVFGFSHDFQGLVDIKIENGKLLLNWSGLKNLIEEMFQHVGYFLELLRPHIKPELMREYTDKLTPGSYYWLQEQLIEKILVGRPALDTTDETKRVGYPSLDEMMRKASYTFDRLTRKWDIDGSGIGLGTNVSNVSPKASQSSYDKVFAELIFYDATRPSSGLIKSKRADKADGATYGATDGVELVDFLHDPYESLHFVGPMGGKVLDTRFAARFYQLYSWQDEFTLNRSALFAFNQLIAKYIQSFYDPVSSKIYSGVLNQFVNGAFSRSIADQSFTYPDTVPILHVKYTSGGEVKIPSTVPLNVGISSSDDKKRVMALKSLFQQYFELGITPGSRNDPKNRAGLLMKTNNPLLAGVANGQNGEPFLRVLGGTPNQTPKIYIYLLAHIIGAVIRDIFNAFPNPDQANLVPNADPILIPAAFSLLSLGHAPVAATLGAARAFYNPDGSTTKSPGIEDIMNKLLDGGVTNSLVNIINRIEPAFVNHSDVSGPVPVAGAFVTPAAGSPLDNIWGARGVQVPRPFTNFPSSAYKDALYSVLRLPRTRNTVGVVLPTGVTVLAEYGGIIERACQIFPLQDDVVGRSAEEMDYRAELIATILVRMKVVFNNAPVGDEVKYSELLNNEVMSALNGVKSAYTTGTAGQPKYIVKQDELLVTDNRFVDAESLHAPLGDSNFLVMARGDAMPGALESDNLNKLGITSRTTTDRDSDTLKNMKQFGRRLDPDGEHVLFTSLSVVLKSLISSRNTQTQSLVYIQDNVADIALYMKERMRANLPAFRNLFKELLARCEYLKKFIGCSELNLERKFDVGAYRNSHGTLVPNVTPTHNPWPWVLQPIQPGSNETKSRFISILDSIARGCTVLMTSCEQVLREIGDDPKYFELYQNSIKDYKAQYNMDPFMPLSSTLTVLKNVNNTNNLDFFPIHVLGQDPFKFMYGTRSLLGQPTSQPLAEHVLGFTQIVDGFNMVIDTKLQADKSRADAFMKTFVKLLRYVHELKHIKSILTPYILIDGGRFGIHPNALPANDTQLYIGGMFARDDLVLTDQQRGTGAPRTDDATPTYSIYAGTGPVFLTNRSVVSLVADTKNDKRKDRNGGRKYPQPVYSVSKTLGDVIKMTESSFKEDKIKELVTYLVRYKKSGKSLEVQNIIDLNIVPINVHALMREIPLVNLYNYAYTFDRLIIELYYGLQNENARKLIAELCDYDNGSTNSLKRITSAKDMLVALLLNPYMNLFADGQEGPLGTVEKVNTYERYTKSMLAGAANNGELGRPKFLSDQIFNKVVFGQLYADPSEYNEMGPAASQVQKIQITEAKGIEVVTLLASYALERLNAVDRFQDHIYNRAMANTNGKLEMLIMPIVKHVAKNPGIRLDDLVKLVYENFLSPTTGQLTFKTFRIAGLNAMNDAKMLAIFASLVVKLVYVPVSLYVNKINKVGFSEDLLNEFSVAVPMLLAVFDNIGNVNGGAYLGLSKSNTHGAPAADSPGSPDAAARAFNISLQKTISFNNAHRPNVLDGISPRLAPFLALASSALPRFSPDWNTVLPKLFSQISIPDALPSPINNPMGTANILTAEYVKTILGSFISTTSKIMSLEPMMMNHDKHASNFLHWLDVYEEDPDKFNKPGVGLQSTARGDNENVLDSRQVNSVDVTGIKNFLADVGRLRFDTVFIRNLVFIVNLYRSVRMKLQRDLVYSKDIILRAEPITRAQLTEFYGNQAIAGDRQLPYDKAFGRMWQRYDY